MEEKIKNAITVFKQGGIVIFPTDTAFGIGCRIDNIEAVKKVYKIKKRDFSKALLVLVDRIDMAKKYVEIPKDVEEKLLKKYWPGGLTVFFKCKTERVSQIVRSGTNLLAVRLPNHREMREVVKKVGVPIIATSANISGRETPYTISSVDKGLLSKVDFVMDGSCTFKQQSTIIDITVNPWKIIREGAVKLNL